MEAPDDRQSRGAVIRLAKWWASATQAQRFEALKAAIRGEEKAPELRTIHLAIIAAEIEATAARERQRSREALHGAAAQDAQVRDYGLE